MSGIHCMLVGAGGQSHILATGGTVTEYTLGDATYRVHTFTASGVFDVTAEGDVERLLVGGGGGGFYGGGGAGGVLNDAVRVTAGSHTVTIGDGGAPNVNGQPSSFFGSIALGGGHGGGLHTAGTAGASGGGAGGANWTDGDAANNAPLKSGGAASQGFAGGYVAAISASVRVGSAGGGGAGGAGGSKANTTDVSRRGGMSGGPGVPSSLQDGTARYYGGGGAGTGTGGGNGGLGGSGVGGNGGSDNVVATPPVQNTGSGGGGAGASAQGTVQSSGAKGVLIIRYRIR